MVVHAGAQSTSQLVSRAVSDLARQTGFPIAFGGLAEQGEIRVSAIVGARSHSIDGLVVRAERGLGGRAFVEGRPRLALDYRTARGITHDYDRAILGEGIATLFAVPVVAAGRTRGVLYCGSWSQAGLDAAVARPALRVAEELATELRIRDEVDRRVAMSAPRSDQRLPAATREELRESYATLRSIAADVADPALRTRIAAVERRIAALTAEPVEQAPASEVRLSPRELDVLSHAAMGSTNAEISEALGLRETTVKSYLATAMAKFDASTRHAAVTAARRAGLLP